MTAEPRRIRLEKSASVAELDGEAVILHLATGEYFQVNGTGAFLLRLLAEGTTVPNLEEAVVARYGIDRSRAAVDVVAWVDMLSNRGLVVEDRRPPPS